MSMSKFASKFDYLLNAFEEASQSPMPAAMGYAEKRRALLEYVAKLEAGTEYVHGSSWTWSLDLPEVSGWRWIETWSENTMTFDVRRFHVGDTLHKDVACWRYIDPPTSPQDSRLHTSTKEK